LTSTERNAACLVGRAPHGGEVLLGNVDQLVRQQAAPARGVRLIFTGREHDVVRECESACIHAASCNFSLGARMYPHLAQAMSKARFEKCAGRRIKRLSGAKTRHEIIGNRMIPRFGGCSSSGNRGHLPRHGSLLINRAVVTAWLGRHVHLQDLLRDEIGFLFVLIARLANAQLSLRRRSESA
jgi:hypothetical protein